MSKRKSLFSGFRRPVQPEPAATPGNGTQTLNEVLDRYDLVDVVHTPSSSAIVVADRPPREDGAFVRGATEKPKKFAENGKVNLQEIGSVSASPWFEEYNEALTGQEALHTYDQMRKSDSTVRGTLRLTKVPVLGARYFVEPASEAAEDELKAQFIWWNLIERLNWIYGIQNMLLMLDFGFIPMEKVFAYEKVPMRGINGTRLVWSKLAPRHPGDFREWEFDAHGEVVSAQFLDPPDDYTIDRSKMLLFTFDNEVGNVNGTSILRSAYPHWYYKSELYKIDAIQKERHGIGVPVIKLPPNFTDDDRRLADALGRNLRTNERAHITLPPLWEVFFAKLEGQPVDVLASINHHDAQIQKNVLARFMDAGTSGNVRGVSNDSSQNMFLKATRFVADVITAEININGIPELVKYNWANNPNGYPKLRARRIGEQADWRAMSFAVRNLVGAGVIRPDDRLEKAMREEMDLPPADPETARELPNGKQRGQRAGQPRQAPPSANSGRDNGADRSGG